MTGLAEALHLSLAAASQLVDRLVASGFVERSEARADRRVKMVSLLPEGKRTLQSLHRTRTRELSAAVAKLPDDVQKDLSRVLTAALDHFEGLTQDAAVPTGRTPR